MKKVLISLTAVVLTLTLVFGAVLLGVNPYAVPGAKTIEGSAPRGALVLDSQSELVYRNDMAYEAEKKNPIDLSDYNLVFNEEFEGSELDETVWERVYPDGTPTRAGVFTGEYTRITDGKLYMPIKLVDYEINGETIRTWAMDDIQLKQVYTYGYFECRAVMPKAHNGLGAFWMQSPDAYTDGIAPEGGVESDIIESQCYGGYHGLYSNDQQVYEVNIHYNSTENRKYLRAHGIKVPGADMYEEFHTYGLLWTPTYYVFYVDGYPAYKTNFGMAGPDAKEYIFLTTDLRGDNYQISSGGYVDNDDTDMIVDYVKIWQLDDPADYPDFSSSKFMTAFNDFVTRIYTFFDRVADFFRDLFKISK